MIDCSDTETAAIRQVHGHSVVKYECLWHVLKAVSEQSKKKLSVSKVATGETKVAVNRALRESGRKDFIRLVYAAAEDDFMEIWNEIQATYVDQKEWLSYLKSEWMNKQEKW
ncbi:hypothetical protein FRC03_006286, partial [Tulasnella sp. 419]